MEITNFAAILILATLVEALVEYLIKPFFADPDTETGGIINLPENVRTLILRYISALVGVGLCLAYGQDLLAVVDLHSVSPVIGQVITGIVIGRGANYLHDLVSRWTT
jgi:hypothetical protein